MILFRTGFLETVILLSILGLSACSNNKTAPTKNDTLQNNTTIKNVQPIATGTIISINTIVIKPEKIDSYGSVGVSVASGGHSGVYGAFDLATLGKVFRNATKPKTAQRFILKKSNGEMAAITQATSKETFKIGDSVKLLLENGEAKVIH